ncbi:MAG: M23 family metallopeptidase [Deltaproteobacteria bacterium]|nr:MAG: M23 family metallopeptidase [Deltaproteobacteria bacterium]
MARRLTIMIVPDRSSRVKRLRISKTALWSLAIGFGVMIVGLVAGAVFYWNVVDRLLENSRLRKENVELRGRVVALVEKVDRIHNVLDRVERFDAKLRAITQLHDPKRHLAQGPFEEQASVLAQPSDMSVNPLVRAIGENPHLALNMLGKQLAELATEAERREGSIRELDALLQGQRARLDATPSIWPARGWVTSGFGIRPDPYTRKLRMHYGIDIANQPGVPVMATAKGLVVFSGVSGGYGKTVVIDHGYGIRTRYGHMNELKVKVGQRVERGEIIGTIGNTGRSTGPHLHYEVEVNGVPEDPRAYILED